MVDLLTSAFSKLQSNSALGVSFQGNMMVYGDYKCTRWYFKFIGNECSWPVTIEICLQLLVIQEPWSMASSVIWGVLWKHSTRGGQSGIMGGTVQRRNPGWCSHCVEFIVLDNDMKKYLGPSPNKGNLELWHCFNFLRKVFFKNRL